MSNNSSLESKYKPTIQKLLFNQKCLIDIKKFIKELTPKESTPKELTPKELTISSNYKKILFLNGPSGCGKSTTIDVLFKNYNIINIDSDNIRLSENINTIINSISSFNSNNLSNFEKKIIKPTHGNILFIKNAQHCEKALNNFIDELYIKSKKNIPIIISCDKQQYRQKFVCDFPITYIDFNQPTYEDFFRLVTTINKDHKLKLSDENINKIIETTLYDTNQLFHILEYIKLNKYTDISNLDNLKKDHDIDLHDKLIYIFDLENKYNFNKLNELTYSDSCVISNCIFQNYLNIIDWEKFQTDHKCNKKDNESIYYLDKLADITNIFCKEYIEDTSINDVNHTTLSTNNNIFNCILPMYEIHTLGNKYNSYINHNLKNSFTTFKNYSYSHINSLKELKTLRFNSYNNIYDIFKNNTVFCTNEELYLIFNNIIECIQYINIKLDNSYKKRSVNIDEYIKLIKKDTNLTKKFTYIIDIIWNYTLFETNEDIRKTKYNDCDIKIDLKILKRYINIYSLTNITKILKITIENLIKNELKNKILLIQNNLFTNNDINKIEQLTYDLSDIWSCMKK